LVIDWTLTHRSHALDGERYSIIAFLHNATWNLTRPELATLRALGYPLNGDATLELESVGAAAHAWVADSGMWHEWDGRHYAPKRPVALPGEQQRSGVERDGPPSPSRLLRDAEGDDSGDAREGDSSIVSGTGYGQGYQGGSKRARHHWLMCRPQGCRLIASNIFTMLNVLEGRLTADRYLVEFCCEEDSALGNPTHESEGCVVLRFPYRLNLLKEEHVELVSACLSIYPCLLWVRIPFTGGALGTQSFALRVRPPRKGSRGTSPSWLRCGEP